MGATSDFVCTFTISFQPWLPKGNLRIYLASVSDRSHLKVSFKLTPPCSSTSPRCGSSRLTSCGDDVTTVGGMDVRRSQGPQFRPCWIFRVLDLRPSGTLTSTFWAPLPQASYSRYGESGIDGLRRCSVVLQGAWDRFSGRLPFTF